jgi:hypothetical protein
MDDIRFTDRRIYEDKGRIDWPDPETPPILPAELPRAFYAANEATPDDEAEEDRIIEEAQAKAARNEAPARSRIIDLTFANGVWKE